jgi:uncharacterized protein with NAD-binding domain and iron-sulfur cluster
MGWYENAFRLMRDCYGQLGRDPASCRIADWTDAFKPHPFAGAMERTGASDWLYWNAMLPPDEGLPGDPYPPGQRFSLAHYMARSLALVRSLLQTLSTRGGLTAGSDAPEPSQWPFDGGPEGVAELISRWTRYGEVVTLTALVQGVGLLESILGSLALYPQNVIVRFLEAIVVNARDQLEGLIEHDAEARRLWTIVDLTIATMRGIVRFGLLTDPRGFDAIDDYDCREWLLLNGASRLSVDSAFVRGLYDLGFSYEDGDPERPSIAAGQSLRATIRAFFTYRGSFFWRMQAGMGDIVFAPLYQILKRRGVRFEFFHRLENVKLADSSDRTGGGPRYVEALEFDVQARIKGDREYEPLVDVRGLPCWPAAPRAEQLIGGEVFAREGWDFESFWDRRFTSKRRLRVTHDFDFVVLGVGIGAIPHVCREIVAVDPRWRAMVDHVKTVATQAFQIWLAADMKQLGWSGPAISVSGFTEPFDTWADMRHLIAEESWKHVPLALAYFCNALPDAAGWSDRSRHDYPAFQRENVRRNAIHFLDQDVAHLWPRAHRAPGEFRWELLVDPDSEPEARARDADMGRFGSQFWTANVNPSDRYSLSLPGSLIYRISPLDNSYDNLTVAGDWTACGFNAGCVEAAVMSGMLAAHAISGVPALEDIIGYDHP